MPAQSHPVHPQDNAWKDVLNRYFPEFVAFFFPHIYAEIDWTRGYEFLEQELAQIARDHRVGRRLADKLVRVWLADGNEQWLLVHLEVQARASADLSKRVYIYHYRIFDRYDCEVVSLVIVTGGSKTFQPQPYTATRWGCELTFRFPLVKLVDYETRWAELAASDNPFAIAVMAHLRVRQARGDFYKLRDWKRELTFMLYERGYGRDDVRALFRFIDWIMILPSELEEQLRTEIYQFEESRTMAYLTPYEVYITEKKFQEGREEGREEGQRNTILRLLQRQFSKLDITTQRSIERLSAAQLEVLTDRLLTFNSLAELKRWLRQQRPARTANGKKAH